MKLQRHSPLAHHLFLDNADLPHLGNIPSAGFVKLKPAWEGAFCPKIGGTPETVVVDIEGDGDEVCVNAAAFPIPKPPRLPNTDFCSAAIDGVEFSGIASFPLSAAASTEVVKPPKLEGPRFCCVGGRGAGEGLPKGESTGTGEDPKPPKPELANPVDGFPNVDVEVGCPKADDSIVFEVAMLCPNFGVKVEASGFKEVPKVVAWG